jgi:hypothetical protein
MSLPSGRLHFPRKELTTMSTSLAAPLRATATLRKSPIPPLRKLSVDETETSVTIRGTVSSYYLKQLAQETVMAVLEGRALSNQVTVSR